MFIYNNKLLAPVTLCVFNVDCDRRPVRLVSQATRLRRHVRVLRLRSHLIVTVRHTHAHAVILEEEVGVRVARHLLIRLDYVLDVDVDEIIIRIDVLLD